jgi:hypothetical protein
MGLITQMALYRRNVFLDACFGLLSEPSMRECFT